MYSTYVCYYNITAREYGKQAEPPRQKQSMRQRHPLGLTALYRLQTHLCFDYERYRCF